MRVAVGAFMQETNDFSPVLTTRDTFEGEDGWGVFRGAQLLEETARLPQVCGAEALPNHCHHGNFREGL